MHAVLTSRNGVGSLPNTLRTGVWDDDVEITSRTDGKPVNQRAHSTR